jgi:meso-butanediol dehydrogenase/(S,S)-butanediol dehydrogenase/diacetyl reductase
MVDLTERIAIVTGGASGIGHGIARVLSGQGAAVVVADRNLEGARAAASALGRDSLAVEVDVTKRASVEALVSAALDRFGKIDILVNNAGVPGAPGWADRDRPDDADWDTAYFVNLRGVVLASEAVEPSMKERRYGKIVNISSISARIGSAVIPHYSAAKAGVINWTQAHALALAPYGVNVNAICPGLVFTPMFEQMFQGRKRFGTPPPGSQSLSCRQQFEQLVEREIPMKREQTPEDIGHLAAFLASDDSRSITGQAINVDGGRRMN